MYKCSVDGEWFHFPSANNRNCIALSGSITTELNRAGTFDFQIPPTNSCYIDGKFKKMISEIEVFWDDNVSTTRLFRGRILDSSRSFLGQISYKCEGWMSVLNDSIVVPASLMAEGQGHLTGDDEKGITATIENMFNALIAVHNAQMGNQGVDINKQLIPYIKAGSTFKNKSINFPWPNYEKTLDYIQSNFLSNDDIGGMMYVESNTVYLVDTNDDDNKVRNELQPIRQGSNLLDLTETIDVTEVYTVIFPTGKDDVMLPAGSGWLDPPTNHYYKNGQSIEAREAIAKYGRIFHYENFSELTNTNNALQNKALQVLKESCETTPSIDISAVDLSIIDPNLPMLRVGDFIRIISQHYDMETWYMCTSSTIDICNPVNTKFMLGKTIDTMTTKQLSIVRNIQSNTLKYGAEISSKTLDINVYDARVSKNNVSFYKNNKTIYLNFSVTALKTVVASSPTIMTFNADHAPATEVTGTAFDETTSMTYTLKVTTAGYVQVIAYGDGIAVDDVVTGNLTWMVK